MSSTQPLNGLQPSKNTTSQAAALPGRARGVSHCDKTREDLKPKALEGPLKGDGGDKFESPMNTKTTNQPYERNLRSHHNTGPAFFSQQSNYVYYGESSNKKSRRQRKLDENLHSTIREMRMMQSLTSNKNEDPLLKSLWDLQMAAKPNNDDSSPTKLCEEEKGDDLLKKGMPSPLGAKNKGNKPKISINSKAISKGKQEGSGFLYNGSHHMLRPRRSARNGKYNELSDEEEDQKYGSKNMRANALKQRQYHRLKAPIKRGSNDRIDPKASRFFSLMKSSENAAHFVKQKGRSFMQLVLLQRRFKEEQKYSKPYSAQFKSEEPNLKRSFPLFLKLLKFKQDKYNLIMQLQNNTSTMQQSMEGGLLPGAHHADNVQRELNNNETHQTSRGRANSQQFPETSIQNQPQPTLSRVQSQDCQIEQQRLLQQHQLEIAPAQQAQGIPQVAAQPPAEQIDKVEQNLANDQLHEQYQEAQRLLEKLGLQYQPIELSGDLFVQIEQTYQFTEEQRLDLERLKAIVFDDASPNESNMQIVKNNLAISIKSYKGCQEVLEALNSLESGATSKQAMINSNNSLLQMLAQDDTDIEAVKEKSKQMKTELEESYDIAYKSVIQLISELVMQQAGTGIIKQVALSPDQIEQISLKHCFFGCILEVVNYLITSNGVTEEEFQELLEKKFPMSLPQFLASYPQYGADPGEEQAPYQNNKVLLAQQLEEEEKKRQQVQCQLDIKISPKVPGTPKEAAKKPAPAQVEQAAPAQNEELRIDKILMAKFGLNLQQLLLLENSRTEQILEKLNAEERDILDEDIKTINVNQRDLPSNQGKQQITGSFPMDEGKQQQNPEAKQEQGITLEQLAENNIVYDPNSQQFVQLLQEGVAVPLQPEMQEQILALYNEAQQQAAPAKEETQPDLERQLQDLQAQMGQQTERQTGYLLIQAEDGQQLLKQVYLDELAPEDRQHLVTEQEIQGFQLEQQQLEAHQQQVPVQPQPEAERMCLIQRQDETGAMQYFQVPYSQYNSSLVLPTDQVFLLEPNQKVEVRENGQIEIVQEPVQQMELAANPQMPPLMPQMAQEEKKEALKQEEAKVPKPQGPLGGMKITINFNSDDGKKEAAKQPPQQPQPPQQQTQYAPQPQLAQPPQGLHLPETHQQTLAPASAAPHMMPQPQEIMQQQQQQQQQMAPPAQSNQDIEKLLHSLIQQKESQPQQAGAQMQLPGINQTVQQQENPQMQLPQLGSMDQQNSMALPNLLSVLQQEPKNEQLLQDKSKLSLPPFAGGQQQQNTLPPLATQQSIQSQQPPMGAPAQVPQFQDQSEKIALLEQQLAEHKQRISDLQRQSLGGA